MRKIFIFLLLSTVSKTYSFAQQENSKNKIVFSISGSAGRSFFVANMFQSRSRFPTNEFRLGMTATKPIAKELDLISGLILGSKMKGDRLYPPGSTPGFSVRLITPFNDLEETVNSRNHYFLEIPLIIQYTLTNKIGFRLGGTFRHYTANTGYFDSSGQYTSGPDFFSNKQEYSVLAGISYNLKKIKLSANYYFGIPIIYSVYGFVDMLEIDFYIKHQSFQFSIDYTLEKKRRRK